MGLPVGSVVLGRDDGLCVDSLLVGENVGFLRLVERVVGLTV